MVDMNKLEVILDKLELPFRRVKDGSCNPRGQLEAKHANVTWGARNADTPTRLNFL